MEEATVLKVAIVGQTGNGKSSLGNSLVQAFPAKVFEAKDPDTGYDPASVTKNVQEAETVYKGKKIKIVDTMGLGDTEAAAPDKSAFDGYKEIFDAVSQQVSDSSDAGIDVFLWCVSTGARFTNEKYEELVQLKNMFGKGIVKHIILVFTSGGPESEFRILGTSPALDKALGELGRTRFTHSEIKAYPGLSETVVRNASRERVLECVLRLSEDNGRKKYNVADAMKDVKDLLHVVGGFPEGTGKDSARTYFLEFLRGQKSRPEAEAKLRPLAEEEDRRRKEADERQMAGCQQTTGYVGGAVGAVGGVVLDATVPVIAHGLAAVAWPAALAGGVYVAGRAVAGSLHRRRNPPQSILRPLGNQVADDNS